VNVQLPFLEMGADSLIMVEAIRVIETEVGTEITDQFPGVQQVAELHWA